MLYVGWSSRQQELEISWPTEMMMMMMMMMMMTVKVLGVLERSHSIPAAITPLSVHYCGDLVNDPKISSSASPLSSLLQGNKEDNHHYYNTFASITLHRAQQFAKNPASSPPFLWFLWLPPLLLPHISSQPTPTFVI